MAPEGNMEEFVAKRLIVNGAVQAASPELSTRIAWAANWAKDVDYNAIAPGDSEQGAQADSVPRLDSKTAIALGEFAQAVKGCKTADDVQGAAFEAIRRSGTKPSEFFSAVYHILLGPERGPRLGPYIMDAGPQVVSEKLARAVEDSRKN